MPKKIQKSLFIRSTDIAVQLEIFIVCAVVAILAIRLVVELAGISEIVIGKWHMTSLQWGVVLMLAALLALLSFITRLSRRFGAVVGGIGFGLLLDNAGRYSLPGDDYMSHPHLALIYVIFIGLYLGFRLFLLRKPLTPKECLVNAIDFVKEAEANGLDRRQYRQAKDLIARASEEPSLRDKAYPFLVKIDEMSLREPYLFDRLLRWGADRYARWAKTGAFKWLVTACFMAIGFYVLYEIAEVLRQLLGQGHTHRQVHNWILFIAYFLSLKSFLVGDIRLLRGKRLSAYRWFNDGLLIWLLVVQIFVFVRAPYKGLIILLLTLFLLGAIRYMIAEEKSLQLKK